MEGGGEQFIRGLAEDVEAFLLGDEERIPSICEGLEFAIPALLADEPKWKYRWVDGVVPRSVQRSDNALLLFGGCHVVEGDTWTVRAVESGLSLEGKSVLRVAGEEDSFPFGSQIVGQIDRPLGWGVEVEFDLRP